MWYEKIINNFRTNIQKIKKNILLLPNETMPRWRNGRRARFRCECLTACRFESYPGHKGFLYGGSLFCITTYGYVRKQTNVGSLVCNTE